MYMAIMYDTSLPASLLNGLLTHSISHWLEGLQEAN